MTRTQAAAAIGMTKIELNIHKKKTCICNNLFDTRQTGCQKFVCFTNAYGMKFLLHFAMRPVYVCHEDFYY